jgi:hypothetical protein
VDDVSKIVQDPAHSILIVLGDLVWLEHNIPQGVVSYVERGGTLLVASDRRSGKSVSDLAGVRISGVTLASRGNLKNCHKTQTDRPFVVPQPISEQTLDNPFEGLKVATNIPSYLVTVAKVPGVYRLARFRREVGVSPEWTGAFERPTGDDEFQFAVGGVRGEGRFLVLADHSVFINEMMLPEDCGNFAFSVRLLLDWLNPGDRSQAMLVEDGRVYPNFDVALKRLPTAPPLELLGAMFSRRDEILDEGQKHFRKWNESDFLKGRMISRTFGRGANAAIRRNTLWVVGGCLLAFFFYRLSSGSRHLADPRVPLLMTAVARQLPTRSLAEQRQYEQLDAGNLWESARVLARQRLSAIADAVDPAQPARVAGGSWWRRRTARRRLERLQAIAYGDTPVRIGPERWEDFLAELDAFDQDVADGTVKLPAV